jgi:hypothetical protein
MKFLFYLLPLFIFVHTGAVSLELSSSSQDGHNTPVSKSSAKKYTVHFLSLKRGHTIASSCFTLEDQNKLEIKIPGEAFLDAKGDYTKNGIQFKARFEGTIIRKKKHYYYTFNISGFSLLDSYIAGTIVLNESIKETHQNQEITFLFLGTTEEDATSDNRKRSIFPF